MSLSASKGAATTAIFCLNWRHNILKTDKKKIEAVAPVSMRNGLAAGSDNKIDSYIFLHNREVGKTQGAFWHAPEAWGVEFGSLTSFSSASLKNTWQAGGIELIAESPDGLFFVRWAVP